MQAILFPLRTEPLISVVANSGIDSGYTINRVRDYLITAPKFKRYGNRIGLGGNIELNGKAGVTFKLNLQSLTVTGSLSVPTEIRRKLSAYHPYMQNMFPHLRRVSNYKATTTAGGTIDELIYYAPDQELTPQMEEFNETVGDSDCIVFYYASHDKPVGSLGVLKIPTPAH